MIMWEVVATRAPIGLPIWSDSSVKEFRNILLQVDSFPYPHLPPVLRRTLFDLPRMS